MSTTLLNQENIIKKVYDPPTESLKVSGTSVVVPGQMEVALSAPDDSVAISDGTDTLGVNPDGSINVVVTSIGGLNLQNYFNELSVASGIATTIISYTATSIGKLVKADVAGENIAYYTVYKNGIKQAKKYTYFQNLNEVFEFNTGIGFVTSDIITVEVFHNRPDPGNFNCNLLIAT